VGHFEAEGRAEGRLKNITKALARDLLLRIRIVILYLRIRRAEMLIRKRMRNRKKGVRGKNPCKIHNLC